jgi:FixJ family two-component response regulator
MEIRKFLEDTEKHLKLILNKLEDLKKQNEFLAAENRKLSTELTEKEKLVTQLLNNELNLQIASKLKNSEEVPELLKTQIDEKIKKIDKCIELLKNELMDA